MPNYSLYFWFKIFVNTKLKPKSQSDMLNDKYSPLITKADHNVFMCLLDVNI